jgi:putative addiction module component (TIGR02574 family)
MSAAKDVTAQALAMSPAERAQLIDDLLASFDPDNRAEIDAAHAREVADRLKAYERGELRTISWEESRRRIGRA